MNGNQIRIAISGKARSGKNLIADLIVKHFNIENNEFKIRAFADPMKQIAKIMFPNADENCLYGASELRENIIDTLHKDINDNYLTYRMFLTDLGKFGRNYNNNKWISTLDYDLNKSQDKKLYIVSDLRFIEEYNYLLNQGFYMIRVIRNGINSGNDISEIEQDKIPNEKFNKLIYNNFSIDVLSDEIKQLVSQWL